MKFLTIFAVNQLRTVTTISKDRLIASQRVFPLSFKETNQSHSVQITGELLVKINAQRKEREKIDT